MAKLLLKMVNKIYENNVHAVKDLCLEIEDKEFLVLVGPSGCGKTTTLRMIAGLEDISSGELYIGDNVVNSLEPKERDIAMVFQNYALYPHMNVYENMAFGLKMRKVPKKVIRERVLNTAGVLDIEDLMSRKPSQLSGGQRQRVALGRAIVREPQVFLMDEPLSNLDAKLRVQMRSEIIKLHKQLNTTFIYVTHDQTEAMTMGSRIAIMKDGIIQQIDTPKNIYNHPANTFVASFIGLPQMNLLDASVLEEQDEIKLALANAVLSLPTDKQECLKKQGYVGKQIIYGIRAENIGLERAASNQPFGGFVEIVEHLGSEAYVYLNTSSGTIVSRIPADADLKIDELVAVIFDKHKGFIFDKETGILLQ
ncbi:MAG: sn-glycerol-3-phosphate ABC transporter ATP-binding protein UgpC [Syntrophomonas sp.]